MQHIFTLFLIVAFCLTPAAQAEERAHAAPAVPDGWAAAAPVSAANWPDLRYTSLNDAGTRLVALDYQSGANDNSRNIVVSELVSGVWQPLAVIAQNGVYATGAMIWLPQYTHPVISGDGNTIVYLGWTGTTNGVYVVDRLSGGGWSAPALINTGLPNTHYWTSLSRDGRTLALCDYPFFGIQKVYVLERGAGGWGAPQFVGNGGNPSLSADGAKLVYGSNAQVAFSGRSDGVWSAPVQLTSNDPNYSPIEYPQLSSDGRAVTYWLVKLVPEGATLIRSAQDLYVLRRNGANWGSPQKVTATPALPSTPIDGPAAADQHATRLVYTRAITTTDPGDGHVYVSSSYLAIGEWRNEAWQEERLVEAGGWYKWWPRLTPDGMTLTFQSDGRVWQMKADTPPPPRPLPTSTSALITPAGGSLFSEIDQTGYLFAPGTFAETVQVTHTVWSVPPPPPPGQISIPGIGGLGRGFEATLLGPGGLPIQPTRPVTITVDYSEVGYGAAIAGTLGLWRQVGSDWVPIPGVDDPVQGKLTATVDHFSHFAVFGETRRLFLPAVMR